MSTACLMAGMRFGNKLRYLMDRDRVTGAEMASDLGVDQATISRWVNNVPTGKGGFYQPKNEYMLVIARKFGVTMESLSDDDMDLEDAKAPPEIPRDLASVIDIVKIISPEVALQRLLQTPEVKPPTSGEPKGKLKNG